MTREEIEKSAFDSIDAPCVRDCEKCTDNHNIDIVVEPEIDEGTDKKWGYCFGLYTEFPSVAVSLVYETYEEALNAGILESLKLLTYEH